MCLVGNEFTLSRAVRAGARSTLLAALAFGSSWSAVAHAQTPTTSSITLDVNSIARKRINDPPGTNYPYRNARRWWVNYDECKNPNEEYFEIPLSLQKPGDPLEVWAGSGQNCAEVRGNEDRTQSCWILAVYDRSEDPMTVIVPVRNIVARQVQTLTPPSGLGPEVCEGSTDNEGDAITFYFFLQDGGQAVMGARATWDPQNLGGTGFDWSVLRPLNSIHLGMGDSQLSVNLDGVQEETDRERFAAYCEPSAEDPDFVPAEGAPPACIPTELAVGVRPNPALKCGEASETSNTITTDPDLPAGVLTNDKLYVVGVSGQDAVDNAGPLSTIACGTPKELDDFFEVYGRASGPGGGGYCSLGPSGSRAAPGAALWLGALLAAFRLRRGRSRA